MQDKPCGWYIHSNGEERMVLSVIEDIVRYDATPADEDFTATEEPLAEFARWLKGATPRPLGGAA